MAVSPQCKVKFNHGMLLFVEYFDTQNKHAYCNSNKTTTTNATEMSVYSLRTPWQSEPYTVLLKCWQGTQIKKHSLFTSHTVYS